MSNIREVTTATFTDDTDVLAKESTVEEISAQLQGAIQQNN